MIEWVLIIYTLTYPHRMESDDKFTNKAACEAVGEALKSANNGVILEYQCKRIKTDSKGVV